MLSPFRRAKIAHQFRLYDTDGDGLLERADLMRVADALAQARAAEPGTAIYQGLMATYEAMWAPMQRRAGGSLHAWVTLEAYLAWHAELLADRTEYESVLGAMAGLL